MRRASVLLLLLGCGGPPAADMPRPVRTASAPVATAAPTTSVERATPEPGVKMIAIESAGEAACVFESQEWVGTVHMRADGPAFARIERAPASLSMPLDGKTAHVAVRGKLSVVAIAGSPEIFLAKPIALAGFIVPFADTSLTVAGPHKTGHLNVALDVSDLFALPSVVSQELDCSALTSVSAGYDADAFVRLGDQNNRIAVRAGSELRLDPKGTSVARLSGGAAATLVGSSGASRRVVMSTRSYHAVGWISHDDLDPHTRYASVPRLRMGAARYGLGGSPSCKKDITVMAQLGDERAEIGKIALGATFSRIEPQPHGLDPEVVAITSPEGWLRLAPGAALLARAADLEGCRVGSAPKSEN
ncbi:MAG: hypothetical protein HOV80_23575 [Polyangiaceae bacterium]|nr:hypothetical protein [Polyangiaceae bacterium]